MFRILLLCALVLGACPRSVYAAEPPPAAAAALEGTAGAVDGESAEVRRELDDILNQPAFRRIRHQQVEKEAAAESTDLSWLEKPFRWLRDLFSSGRRSSGAGIGGLWTILAYAVLIAICSLLVWLIVRAIVGYQAANASRLVRTLVPEEGEFDLPPGDLPADEYRRRAAEFADAGRFREAIGQLILGAMSRTERMGLIRFRRGLTHRDYLRALRGREGAQRSFRELVRIYEPICFGRRLALPEQYVSAEAHYVAGFETVAETAGAGVR